MPYSKRVDNLSDDSSKQLHKIWYTRTKRPRTAICAMHIERYSNRHRVLGIVWTLGRKGIQKLLQAANSVHLAGIVQSVSIAERAIARSCESLIITSGFETPP